jgi:hypothetical protein
VSRIVDVLFIPSLVNILLGWAYAGAFFSLVRLIHHSMNTTPAQWLAAQAAKGLWISFFFLVAVTCATVSYQNFFGDFTKELLWWRLGIILMVTYTVIRVGTLVKSVRKVF